MVIVESFGVLQLGLVGWVWLGVSRVCSDFFFSQVWQSVEVGIMPRSPLHRVINTEVSYQCEILVTLVLVDSSV